MGTERQIKRSRRVARKYGMEVVETSAHFQTVLTAKQLRRVARMIKNPREDAAPVIAGAK